MAGGRVFINYRRDDSRADAGRIYDRLGARFPGKVFRDVGSLEPGVEWHEAIQKVLGASDACVVVIGKAWVSLADSAGRRRLDDPNDTVRMEIRTALSRQMRVIPVLVGGSSMPAEEELPEEIRSLARRNALQITEQDWDEDLAKLIRGLEQALGLPSEKKEQERSGASFNAKFSFFGGRFKFAFAGALALSLCLVAVSVYNSGRGGAGNITSASRSPGLPSQSSEPSPSAQDSPRETATVERQSPPTESRAERSPVAVDDKPREPVEAAPPAVAARPAPSQNEPNLPGSWHAVVVGGGAEHEEQIYVYADGSYAVNYANTAAAVGRWRYEPSTMTLESEGVIIATGIKYACRLTSGGNDVASFRGGCSNIQGLTWTLDLNRTSAAPAADDPPIPGLDLSGLTSAEKVAFARLLEMEPCLCGCGLNLLACRRDETEHCANSLMVARQRLGQFLQVSRR